MATLYELTGEMQELFMMLDDPDMDQQAVIARGDFDVVHHEST